MRKGVAALVLSALTLATSTAIGAVPASAASGSLGAPRSKA